MTSKSSWTDMPIKSGLRPFERDMRLDLWVRPRKDSSYPQFRREIPASERVRGYGESIRTQGLGYPRTFESAAIGGS